MKFEWDEGKDRKNIRKHGIAFEDAIKVFQDPDRLFFYDSQHSSLNEERWQTIGQVAPNILFVVYIFYEKNELYRLISARKANAEEKRKYRRL